MAEWAIAAVLKTARGRPLGSSNLPPSATHPAAPTAMEISKIVVILCVLGRPVNKTQETQQSRGEGGHRESLQDRPHTRTLSVAKARRIGYRSDFHCSFGRDRLASTQRLRARRRTRQPTARTQDRTVANRGNLWFLNYRKVGLRAARVA